MSTVDEIIDALKESIELIPLLEKLDPDTVLYDDNNNEIYINEDDQRKFHRGLFNHINNMIKKIHSTFPNVYYIDYIDEINYTDDQFGTIMMVYKLVTLKEECDQARKQYYDANIWIRVMILPSEKDTKHTVEQLREQMTLATTAYEEYKKIVDNTVDHS